MSSTLRVDGQATSPLTLPEIVNNVLQVLAHTLGVRYTAFMRIEGNTVTVSSLIDTAGVQEPGSVYAFEDTFCAHMLRTGQSCIPDVQMAGPEIQHIRGALNMDVAAYMGVPIRLSDGHIYGTLCALDEHPYQWQGEHLNTLALFARLLAHEFNREAQLRAAERSAQFGDAQQLTDAVTGLLSGAAFESHLRSEERRLRRYGGLYSIAVLELKYQPMGSGTESDARWTQLVQGFANTLMLNSRIVDCCARLEDGRFAVLFPETPASGIPAWLRRINAAVRTWNLLHPGLDNELSFAIGTADSDDADDYRAVWAMATSRMTTDQARQEAAPAATMKHVVDNDMPQRRESDYIARVNAV